MIFIDQGEDKMFFFPEETFCLRGVLARGGVLQEGSFGQREGGVCWRGFLAGGGFWSEGGFGRRGVLAGGGVLSGGGFCPVPIDNNGGYTKYYLYSGKHLIKYLYMRKNFSA